MKECIVLFGAGVYATNIISKVEDYFTIEAICDNNAEIWGQMFRGMYPVISVKTFLEKYADCRLLIALNDKKSVDIVSEQLDKLSIRNQHVNDALYDECMKNGELFFISPEARSEADNINSGSRNIFVLTAPAHSNLGDQAQTYCIETLLKECYIDSNILIYDEYSISKHYYELLYIMKQSLKPEDLILLHSGYRLTNLYMTSEYIVEMMGQLFLDKKMVFLPQTIHYTDEVIEKRISKNIQSNVVIMCRDKTSLENAKRIFTNSKALLFPDVVTSLIGRYQFHHERKGILLCTRNTQDGESMVSEDDIHKLTENLWKLCEVSRTDTTIDVPWKEIAKNREYYIEREIERYSSFQLIVTNRYHGTIFSLAANTPVIVLPTKDHKITSGLQWFEEAGFKDIYICKKLENVSKIAEKVLRNNKSVCNYDYFHEKYYKNFDVESYL